MKKRLIGATVMVSLIVIFVPMLLEHEPVLEQEILTTNIPVPPKSDFSSRIIPEKSEPPRITPRATAPMVGRSPSDKGARPAPSNRKNGKNPVKPEVETRVGLSAWMVQVGSFSQRVNAEKVVKLLRGKAFAADLEPATVKGKTLYRVLVGPEVDRKQAEKILARVNAEVKSLKLTGKLKRYP